MLPELGEPLALEELPVLDELELEELELEELELEELLELDELELGELLDGGVVLGVWGVVGLLALGQPASNRQAQASAAGGANRDRGVVRVLPDFIISGHVFNGDWLAHGQRRAKPGFSQFAHDAVYLAAAQVVFVEALQVANLALCVDGEGHLQQLPIACVRRDQ